MTGYSISGSKICREFDRDLNSFKRFRRVTLRLINEGYMIASVNPLDVLSINEQIDASGIGHKEAIVICTMVI